MLSGDLQQEVRLHEAVYEAHASQLALLAAGPRATFQAQHENHGTQTSEQIESDLFIKKCSEAANICSSWMERQHRPDPQAGQQKSALQLQATVQRCLPS
jgi:hypothetical protein